MPLEITQLAPEFYPLVNRFYRQYQRGTKVSSQHRVWIGRELDKILCSVRLQTVTDGHWLTSLLVDPQQRQRGYASALLTAVRANCQGPIWLFCAPELSVFYSRMGYTVTESLPESLTDRLARYQRHKPLIALVSE